MWRPVKTLIAVCVAALAVVGTASAAQRRVAVGNAAALPHGTSLTGAVNPHRHLQVTLSLDVRNPLALHTLALAVATPGSRQYGRTLDVHQFAARFGATDATLHRVRAAMRRAGLHVDKTYPNHLSITVSGSAATVQRTFATRLRNIRLPDGRRTIANTSAPTLPDSIAGSVQAVFGLDGVVTPQPAGRGQIAQLRRRSRHVPNTRAGERHPASARHVATGGPQPCAAATAAGAPSSSTGDQFGYTADALAAAYGLPALYAQGDFGQGQTIAVYEFESLNPADISAFQTCYGTAAPVSILPVDTPDPIDSGTDGDGEATLDVDQIIGMAPQATVDVYEASQSDPDGLGAMLSALTSSPAKIISISYGSCEEFDGKIAIQAEAKYYDEFAVQGQSVFASTGDSGAEGCYRDDFDSSTVSVSTPASYPTVTAVGGTSLYAGTSAAPTPWTGSGALTEGVWNTTLLQTTERGGLSPAASGGGVSSVWAMPAFQSKAAAALGVVNGFSSGGGCGAADCREIPDVSADAEPETGEVIYGAANPGGAAGASWQVSGGTSASAPLWAAFAALTNVLPGCRGLSIGDINPSLYALAGAGYGTYFRDASAPAAFGSQGDNAGGGAGSPGYPVAAGYDLATGLGAPQLNNLAPALCATRAPVYTVTLGPPRTTRITLGQKTKLHVAASDSGGAALVFSATGLPPGLKLDASSGLISGTPKKVGAYPVSVAGEDFATNGGSTQFTLRVVRPTAHFGRTSLAGVAVRRAKLRFTVSAPRGRRLRSVTIDLFKRSGLSFKRSNRGIFVHSDTGRHHRAVGGRAGRRNGSLTLRFRHPQRAVIVVIGHATLRTGGKLARAARRRTVRVAVGLSATDTHHDTTRHTAHVKVVHHRRRTKHHHHHHKHHR